MGAASEARIRNIAAEVGNARGPCLACGLKTSRARLQRWPFATRNRSRAHEYHAYRVL